MLIGLVRELRTLSLMPIGSGLGGKADRGKRGVGNEGRMSGWSLTNRRRR